MRGFMMLVAAAVVGLGAMSSPAAAQLTPFDRYDPRTQWEPRAPQGYGSRDGGVMHYPPSSRGPAYGYGHVYRGGPGYGWGYQEPYISPRQRRKAAEFEQRRRIKERQLWERGQHPAQINPYYNHPRQRHYYSW